MTEGRIYRNTKNLYFFLHPFDPPHMTVVLLRMIFRARVDFFFLFFLFRKIMKNCQNFQVSSCFLESPTFGGYAFLQISRSIGRFKKSIFINLFVDQNSDIQSVFGPILMKSYLLVTRGNCHSCGFIRYSHLGSTFLMDVEHRKEECIPRTGRCLVRYNFLDATRGLARPKPIKN